MQRPVRSLIAVLPHLHGMENGKTFEAFALLSNVTRTVAKSLLCRHCSSGTLGEGQEKGLLGFCTVSDRFVWYARCKSMKM